MIASGVIRGGREEPGDGDPDAIFELGSITKSFTAVLLAELVERGEVRLDDPLDAYLETGLEGPPPTLLELATHTSGLPNTPRGLARELAFALDVPGVRNPWEDVDEESLLRALARARRQGRVRYSSLGFELLGRALARAAGSSYEELVRERICAPLGLDATFVRVPAPLRGRVLTGTSWRGRPRPPMDDLLPAAGGLRSSVRDLLRFLAACLEPPGGTIGRALRRAQQPRVRASRRVSIALGWIVLDARTVWHNGATWGFASFAGFVPGAGRAAAVLSSRAWPVRRRGLRLLETAADRRE